MAGNAWIAERKLKSYKHGSTIAAHDSRLLGSWIKLDAQLRAKGGTLLQAGDLCLKMWSAKGVESVEDTLEVYLKDRKKIGRQASTLSSTKGKVIRLLKAHPSINLLILPIREITQAQVQEAIDGRKGKLKMKGLEYERQRLRDFFSWCVRHELISESPVPKKNPDLKEEEKKRKKTVLIFSPIEARELLLEAHAYGQSSIMCWVVLGLFCGVRPDSTFRVWNTLEGGKRELYEWKWSALHKALRTDKLEIVDKVGEREQSLTPQAIEWIKWLISHYGIKNGEESICAKNWAITLKAFRAGWRAKHKIDRWPDDVLRHTFGTYRMHTCETVASLADEMGNSPSIIEKYYFKKGVDNQDVADFWNLTPALLAEDYEVDTREFQQPRDWHESISHKII